jgi:hypothetical protein
MWHKINSPDDVPEDRDVWLAVIDSSETAHPLIFPCRRAEDSWVDAKLRRRIDVHPTHWQEWTAD